MPKKKKVKIEKNKIIMTWLAVVVVALIAGIGAGMHKLDKDADKPVKVSGRALVRASQEYKQSYIGLTEDDARAKAQHDGLVVRVVDRGTKEPIAITDDLRDDRVNFTIIDGRITRVEFY